MYSKVLYILSFLPTTTQSEQDSVKIDLSSLEPLYEPEAVQFSFQTPGWYILLALAIVVILVFLIKWIRQYHRNMYRRDALKNLKTIESQFNSSNDTSNLNDVFVLLKYVAIQKFGRKTVAQSYGENWLNFLEEKGKGTPFRKHAPAVSAILYDSGEVSSAEAKQLVELTRKWIKTNA